MRHIAIVLAAGRGKRMNSKVAKQYLLLRDRPVLYYALKQFEDSFIDDIILVTAEDEISYCKKEIVEKYGFTKLRNIVAGGKERYHSVYQGLLAVREVLYQHEGYTVSMKEDMIKQENPDKDFCVYIHDGARPFINEEILVRARESVLQYGSGVVGMPVKDTIKLADEEGFAVSTPKRSLVWQVQTPQCFLASVIMLAYDRLMEKEKELLEQGVAVTDDAMVVELLTGDRVKLTEGSYENIKITTPEDLVIAEGFLDRADTKIHVCE